MATQKPRYMISVPNEIFEQIEDFRFKNRFQTRSAATTELIRLGIEALKNASPNESIPTPLDKK